MVDEQRRVDGKDLLFAGTGASDPESSHRFVLGYAPLVLVSSHDRGAVCVRRGRTRYLPRPTRSSAFFATSREATSRATATPTVRRISSSVTETRLSRSHPARRATSLLERELL